MVLNGWRRLGVVLVAIWAFSIGGIAVYEVTFMDMRGRQFTYLEIPIGTLVDGEKATLPDGRTVKIDSRDPLTGRLLQAWEIDWAKQADVPKTMQIRWGRLIGFVLAAPVSIWLAFEVAVWIGGWVTRGFRRKG
jgi:hypothetical protein